MKGKIVYRLFLIAVFLAVWILAAINPLYPGGWLIENYLVFFFVPVIILLGFYFRLSNLSYTLLTAFLCLHVLGSHYTYAEVPFGYVLQEWFGSSRNMYDRLVHFGFGLLLVYPVREMFMRLSKTRGFWSYWFPIELTFAFSAIYEIIEWGGALVFDPAAGLAFVGAQGDIWDAQKDMALAGLGAIITMSIVFVIRLRYEGKKHLLSVWSSLRPSKQDEVLGEEKLMKLMKGRKP